MKKVSLHFKNNAGNIFIYCSLGDGSIDYLSVVILVGNLSDLIFIFIFLYHVAVGSSPTDYQTITCFVISSTRKFHPLFLKRDEHWRILKAET